MVLAMAATLAACTAPPPAEPDTSVTVAVSQPLTSLNPVTSYGSTTVNEQVAYATGTNFSYFSSDFERVDDSSFGSVELVSSEPTVAKYTVNDGVTWSDGTPVDAADLLLSWAAGSGALNTAGFDAAAWVDPATGRYRDDIPADVVWFDNQTERGLRQVTALPEIGDDGRSLTLTWDTDFVEWQTALQLGVPAHVLGERLGAADADAAKDAVIDAIETRDPVALPALSRDFTSAFDLDAGTPDAALLVSSGPYTVTAVDPGLSVTLTANERYTGSRHPQFEEIIVRTIDGPAATVAALGDGSVDIVSPPATADSAQALVTLRGMTVVSGFSGSFAHLDLQFSGSKSGTFDDPAVRQAFLATVPRQQIVDAIVGPVQEDAAVRSSFLFFPGTDEYTDAIDSNGSDRFTYGDPAAAQAILQEAGVSAGEACILYDPTDPQRVEQYSLIAASATQAGFTVTDCSRDDWQSVLGVDGAYDASLVEWAAPIEPVGVTAARLQSGSGQSNTTHYSNATVDSLLASLAAEEDPVDRAEILLDIDTALFADGFGVPLYQVPSLTAFNASVQGIEPSPLAPGVFWNIWEWAPSATN